VQISPFEEHLSQFQNVTHTCRDTHHDLLPESWST
jgi:hypothetical protein